MCSNIQISSILFVLLKTSERLHRFSCLQHISLSIFKKLFVNFSFCIFWKKAIFVQFSQNIFAFFNIKLILLISTTTTITTNPPCLSALQMSGRSTRSHPDDNNNAPPARPIELTGRPQEQETQSGTGTAQALPIAPPAPNIDRTTLAFALQDALRAVQSGINSVDSRGLLATPGQQPAPQVVQAIEDPTVVSSSHQATLLRSVRSLGRLSHGFPENNPFICLPEQVELGELQNPAVINAAFAAAHQRLNSETLKNVLLYLYNICHFLFESGVLQRNALEYLTLCSPTASAEDVQQHLADAKNALELSHRLSANAYGAGSRLYTAISAASEPGALNLNNTSALLSAAASNTYADPVLGGLLRTMALSQAIKTSTSTSSYSSAAGSRIGGRGRSFNNSNNSISNNFRSGRGGRFGGAARGGRGGGGQGSGGAPAQQSGAPASQ